MIQEIHFTGHTSTPADRLSPDGDLTISLNLLNEDGIMRPIPEPKDLFTLPQEYRLLCIHNPSLNVKNYIISHPYDDGSTDILFIPASLLPYEAGSETNAITAATILQDTTTYRICTLDHTVSDCNTIGNILLLFLDNGILYSIFDTEKNSYKLLGSHIPEIDISFALASSTHFTYDTTDFKIELYAAEENQKKYIMQLTGYYNGTGREPLRPAYVTTTEGKAFKDTISNAIYAHLNKFIKDCSDKGQFTQPFFIRYAYKLFDGSYLMASAPILMIPNSQAPTILCKSLTSSNDILTIENKIGCIPCSLLYRVTKGIDQLLKWKDIVSSLDIFATPQIFTFDQDGDVSLSHRTALSESYPVFRHYGLIANIPTRGDTEVNYHRPSTGSQSSNEQTYSLDSNIEHREDFTQHIWFYSKKSVKDIEAGIRNAAQFYRIASIDIENLNISNQFKILDPENNLSTIQQQPLLSDDFDSHASILASYSLDYNARLTLANVSLRPFPGFTLKNMLQYSQGAPDEECNENVTVYVKLKRANTSVWVCSEEDEVFSPALQFPRWLYYPDTNAKEMILATDNGYWHVHLTSHDFLNGAYWFRGLGADTPEFFPGDIPEEISACQNSSSLIPLKNKVYVSEINNPFYFPATNIVSVGVGEVKAITSAARPLSQGQFGQFPLYALSTNGVWALEIGATGVITARQPITRDICINTEGITQLDSAVLFPTDRGIMMIAGSQTQCISDTISSEFPFDPHSLPAFPDLFESLSNEYPGLSHVQRASGSSQEESPVRIIPFSQFLRKCRMIYDYIHQRVIIYAKGVSYAYIYSLRTKLWGMIQSHIQSSLNSYPDALAITNNGEIVSFSETETAAIDSIPAILLTRPIKLSDSETLKTIDTLITRGEFEKGHVSTVLYGSRDLRTWHPILSSKSHILRAFRGTPYKYFRLLLLCRLNRDESIHGASISYNPRLINRLR